MLEESHKMQTWLKNKWFVTVEIIFDQSFIFSLIEFQRFNELLLRCLPEKI